MFDMRPHHLIAVCAIALGCQRSAPDTGAAPAPSASAAASALVPVPYFEHPNYAITLQADGPFKKGQPASFKVILRSKAGFHINEEYPTKFSAAVSPEVTYPTPKLARAAQPEAFKLVACPSGNDHCSLELTVKFTPEQAGSFKVGGELSLGVCNKDNCIFDKRALAVDVTAS